MDFEPTEIQSAIVGAAAGALENALAWKALGHAGLLSLPVPSWLGGEGLGMPEVGALLTEVGRRAVTLPVLPTLAAAALPVARWGTAEQQRDLLGPVGGGRVLTAALREPSAPTPTAPATRVTAGGAVTGIKIGVWYAEQAYRILVPVSRPAGETGVALVDPAGPGVTLRRTPASGEAPEYSVRLENAPSDGFLGCDAAALHRYAIAGACALGDGLLAGALTLTTAHVGARQQFGRPLSTFQAVAQQIADVYIAARTTHLTALAAAADPDGSDVEVAAYWFASSAPAAVRTCHHLHGGIGLDVTYPMGRYSAQVKDLVRFLGGTEHCLDRLGESTGDGRCSSN